MRTLTVVVRDGLALATRAREAFDDGDLALVEQTLNNLVRELEQALHGRRRGLRCDTCGLAFTFPGQLDEHMRFVHWADDWKRSTAA